MNYQFKVNVSVFDLDSNGTLRCALKDEPMPKDATMLSAFMIANENNVDSCIATGDYSPMIVDQDAYPAYRDGLMSHAPAMSKSVRLEDASLNNLMQELSVHVLNKDTSNCWLVNNQDEIMFVPMKPKSILNMIERQLMSSVSNKITLMIVKDLSNQDRSSGKLIKAKVEKALILTELIDVIKKIIREMAEQVESAGQQVSGLMHQSTMDNEKFILEKLHGLKCNQIDQGLNSQLSFSLCSMSKKEKESKQWFGFKRMKCPIEHHWCGAAQVGNKVDEWMGEFMSKLSNMSSDAMQQATFIEQWLQTRGVEMVKEKMLAVLSPLVNKLRQEHEKIMAIETTDDDNDSFSTNQMRTTNWWEPVSKNNLLNETINQSEKSNQWLQTKSKSMITKDYQKQVTNSPLTKGIKIVEMPSSSSSSKDRAIQSVTNMTKDMSLSDHDSISRIPIVPHLASMSIPSHNEPSNLASSQGVQVSMAIFEDQIITHEMQMPSVLEADNSGNGPHVIPIEASLFLSSPKKSDADVAKERELMMNLIDETEMTKDNVSKEKSQKLPQSESSASFSSVSQASGSSGNDWIDL